MSLIKEEKFILVDIENNNNKFWNIELHDDGTVITSYGRVGFDAHFTPFPKKGESFYNSKVREKIRKGYTPQATISGTTTTRTVPKGDLTAIARKQILSAKANPVLDDLVGRLAAANVHQILESTTLQYNAASGSFSTPLGLVTAEGVLAARKHLSDIAQLVQRKAYEDTIPFLNQYLRLIPQDIGMRRLEPATFVPDMAAIAQQNGILDSLEASLLMAAPMDDKSDLEPEKRLFNVSLDLMTDTREIGRIRSLYQSTSNVIHAASAFQVKSVYTVQIDAMKTAFEKHGKPLGNVRTLWHGTRVGNVLSILKNGFMIPPASASHCTGRLFGNGVYFAIQSTKSLNYSYGAAPGQRGGYSNSCFMFLVDVAMGKSYVPRYGEHLPKAGYDSTWAKPGQSGIQNDEIIVYKTNQANPILLVEFSR